MVYSKRLDLESTKSDLIEANQCELCFIFDKNLLVCTKSSILKPISANFFSCWSWANGLLIRSLGFEIFRFHNQDEAVAFRLCACFSFWICGYSHIH